MTRFRGCAWRYRKGKYHAEALVIHPQESTFALWESKAILQGEEATRMGRDWAPVTSQARAAIGELDQDLDDLTDALLGNQRTWDFGDETILSDDGAVVSRDGRPFLQIGEMEYPAVIVPSLATISPATLDLLEEFQRIGGPILRCGKAPLGIDGEKSPRLEKWLQSVPQTPLDELAPRFQSLISPLVECLDLPAEDARMLFAHVRDLENGERLVFLTNLSRFRDFPARVLLRGAWSEVFELDIRRGDEKALHAELTPEGVVVELAFARTQGHLLRLAPAWEAQNGDSNGISLPAFPKLPTRDVKIENWTVERLDDNALTLDYAAWKTDADWSEQAAPVIALQNHLNLNKYAGPLSLRYAVQVESLSPERRVDLVVEHPERYRITVNGRAVSYDGLPFWRDIRWLPIDISGLLQAGKNSIELFCADFQFGDLGSTHDQEARYGTEIESITLVGDFSVRGVATDEKPRQGNWDAWDLPPVGVQCFAPNSFVLTEPQPLRFGDSTLQGLPFYAGRLQLRAPLPPAVAGARRARLNLANLDAPVAEIAVDGRILGTVWAHPLQIEIDAEALQGAELQITLYSTLRNLLGPHHHSQGELVQVGPDSFWPHYAANYDPQSAFLSWSRGEITAADWNHRYCMVSFGELGTVSLQIDAN